MTILAPSKKIKSIYKIFELKEIYKGISVSVLICDTSALKAGAKIRRGDTYMSKHAVATPVMYQDRFPEVRAKTISPEFKSFRNGMYFDQAMPIENLYDLIDEVAKIREQRVASKRLLMPLGEYRKTTENNGK
jgi:hypothetical protein